MANWAKALTGLGEDVKAGGRLIGGLLYQQEQTAADRLYAADEKRKDRLYAKTEKLEDIERATAVPKEPMGRYTIMLMIAGRF